MTNSNRGSGQLQHLALLLKLISIYVMHVGHACTLNLVQLEWVAASLDINSFMMAGQLLARWSNPSVAMTAFSDPGDFLRN